MKIKYKIIVVFLLISIASIGQSNIQLGYDYNIILDADFPTSSYGNRFIIEGEQNHKNWLFGAGVGIDITNINYVNLWKTDYYPSSECQEGELKYNAQLLHLRVKLSGGYLINLGDNSGIGIKLNYAAKQLLKKSIFESERTIKAWGNCPEDHEDIPPYTESTVSLDIYRYKKFVFNQLGASVDYRYNLNRINLHAIVGFNMFENAIFSDSYDNKYSGKLFSNAIFFGFRIGYTVKLSK